MKISEIVKWIGEATKSPIPSQEPYLPQKQVAEPSPAFWLALALTVAIVVPALFYYLGML